MTPEHADSAGLASQLALGTPCLCSGVLLRGQTHYPPRFYTDGVYASELCFSHLDGKHFPGQAVTPKPGSKIPMTGKSSSVYQAWVTKVADFGKALQRAGNGIFASGVPASGTAGIPSCMHLLICGFWK